MRTVAVTICGNRYDMSLSEELALFVEKSLNDSNVYLDQDNKADKILQAYLKLAKQNSEYETKITNLLQKLEI